MSGSWYQQYNDTGVKQPYYTDCTQEVTVSELNEDEPRCNNHCISVPTRTLTENLLFYQQRKQSISIRHVTKQLYQLQHHDLKWQNTNTTDKNRYLKGTYVEYVDPECNAIFSTHLHDDDSVGYHRYQVSHTKNNLSIYFTNARLWNLWLEL